MTAETPPVAFGSKTQASAGDLDANLVKAGASAVMYGGVSTGSPNAPAITVPNAITQHKDGYIYCFVAGASSTGAATLTVTPQGGSALPSLTLCNEDGTALGAGAIIAGRLYEFVVVTVSGVTRLRWPPKIAGGVSSVFGRAGSVVGEAGDYQLGQIARPTDPEPPVPAAATAVETEAGALSGVFVTPAAMIGALKLFASWNPETNTGHTELPGLLIEIGTGVSSIDGPQDFNFSHGFPSGCLIVIPTVISAGASEALAVIAATGASFTIDRNDGISGSLAFKYFAVGY